MIDKANFRTIDLGVFIIANLVNLLLVGIFLFSQPFGDLVFLL
jgi:hypothetical protein